MGKGWTCLARLEAGRHAGMQAGRGAGRQEGREGGMYVCSMCLFVFKAAGPWYTLIYNIFHTFERAHHIFTISSSVEPLL